MKVDKKYNEIKEKKYKEWLDNKNKENQQENNEKIEKEEEKDEKKEIPGKDIKKGDLIGIDSFLKGKPREETVIAGSDDVKVVCLSNNEFNNLIGDIEDVIRRNDEIFNKYYPEVIQREEEERLERERIEKEKEEKKKKDNKNDGAGHFMFNDGKMNQEKFKALESEK